MENGVAVQRIVEASWRAIAKDGVRKFRVGDVARDAGVSVGLVYYHFENRIGLLRATMDYASRVVPQTGLLDPSPEDTARRDGFERLRALLLADFAGNESSQDNAVVWYEIMGEAIFEPEVRGPVNATLTEWHALIRGAIQAGQQDGSMRDDVSADEVADVLTSLIDGLLARVITGLIDWDQARTTLIQALDTLLLPAR